MQGIIFIFEEARSVKNKMFTIRIEERRKEGNTWIPAGPRGFYTARDLQRPGLKILDKQLFSMAFQSEIDVRKSEGRFFSLDTEMTLFRVAPCDLKFFLEQCAAKKILCDPDGTPLRFRYAANIIPDIRFRDSGKEVSPEVALAGSRLISPWFAMVSDPVRILSGNCVYELAKGLPCRIVENLLNNRPVPRKRYEEELKKLSRYAGKLNFNLPGKKKTIRNGPVTPLLDIDTSFRFARLAFLYEGAGRFAMGDRQEMIFIPQKNVELYRNFREEAKFRDALENAGVIHRPTSRGEWFLPAGKREEILNRLKRNGFRITHSGHPLEPDIRITWNIGMRDQVLSVGGAVQYGEARTDMENILDAYLSDQPWFGLPNGCRGMIPHDLVQTFQKLEQRGDFRDDDIEFSAWDFSLIAELFQGKKGVSVDHAFGEYLSFLEEIAHGTCNIEIPASLNAGLRPYQETGFSWLAGLQKFGFGGILADDMGLGKTIQVLTLLLHLKKTGTRPHSTLLILPKTLAWNWETEIKKFAPSLETKLHLGQKRDRSPGALRGKDLVITSYGIARQDVDLLSRISWDLVVLDEAQAVKNPDAKISRAVKTLKTSNRLALTGTPIENRPLDLWNIFDFLMPGFLGDRDAFQTAYERSDENSLHTLGALTAPFILRRMKQQVCRDLPQKTEITRFCEFSETQKRIYDKTLETGKQQLSDSAQSMQVLTLLLRLRQAACHPALIPGPAPYTGSSGKFEAILETARDILAGGYKILIFSQFVALLELVKEMFEAHGIEQHTLYGATRQRKAVVDRFKDSPNPCVFLISLKTGGVGLNLTEAGYVFLLDPWWNPAVEHQAVDRSHRIGQENPVTVYRFITKNSVEEQVDQRKEKKRRVERAVLQQGDPGEIPFSKKELLELIRDQ